jgi:ABC-type multidrug transport system fused ATPase/permease subunit
MSGPTTWAALSRVLHALAPRTRTLVWVTALLGFLTGLLEAVGVGAVVPLVVVLTEPQLAERYPAIARALPAPLLADRPWLVLATTAAFAALFLAKTALALLVTYLQSRARGRCAAELASTLFSDYLFRPYAFHLHRNLADLSTRLVNGVHAAAHMLQGLSQLLVEGIALAAIVGLLFYANPLAALVTSVVIGLPAVAVHRALRRRIAASGEEIHALNTRSAESTLHALAGIKEVKVLGREEFFHAGFAAARDALGRVEARYGVLQGLPRLMLELATVFAVLGLAGALAAQGRVTAIAPVLGLYAAAAFRLLPAANRVLMAFQMIRFSEAGLHKVAEDLAERHHVAGRDREAAPLRVAEAVRLEGVSFTYPGSRAPVLTDLSLAIGAGECIGLMGASGAGKSTLVDLLLGLLAPGAGRITVDGQDIAGRLREWQAAVGYVPQATFLLDDTVRANVAFGVEPARVDDARVWQALAGAQLEEFVRAQPQQLDARVGERGVRISGGQRQRIAIARALYRDPAVLVLDEATSALDTATEAEFMDAVFRLRGRRTLLIVAHRLATLRRCDRICVLEGGRLQEPRTWESLARAAEGAGR